ncbi:MAG: conjugal transfer protein TraG N-terminal domain-containing protein [Steroidobacteraceae bacterium]
MMRKTWPLLLLGVLSSPVALAGGMNPAGYNAWDYYVFGDGPAIYHILQSVKMLMLPWGGGGMFESLLIAIALIGSFLVIIEAGFSPSKGVEKLIGYFLTLAFVVFLTMGARVNVTINDNATGYYNTVTQVPAIVGVPAAVISEIGYKLERGIEQDFSIPNGLKVSQSGIYDVMGQTLKDANRMVITDPNLKRDLAGYVENCVVPEIGLGRVSVKQLMNSSNLLSTFGAAATPSLLTPYYPVGVNSPATSLSDQGKLERCDTVYGLLKTDVQDYAGALMTAQTAQWQSTGIMVPFGTAMQDVLQEAASGGGGNPTVGGYSNPESYILQNAMINTSRRAFQDAAAELGENPVMLSTAISQADQTQRSSWFTTVTVFHNMMGYVYIVLQAFVLALVPIIAVMLLLPGMGGKIFLNYLQVLLWLVLWGPLFAVENFVVALHGGEQLHNLLAPGLSMMNFAAMTKSTINLNLAASFLGTLIPLLAWGIVNGSFAFTEFILSGMGSAFGQQAGSIAASGNLSLGNTSLDNVGMNKYSTSITSDIGDGGVNLGIGAGKLSSNFQAGGFGVMADKTSETPTTGYTGTWSAQIGHQRIENLSKRQAEAVKTDLSQRASILNGFNSDITNGLSRLHSDVNKYGVHTAAEAKVAAEAAQDYAGAAKLLSQHALKGGVSGKLGAGTGKGGVGLQGGADVNGGFEGTTQLAHEKLAKGLAATKALEGYQAQYAHTQDGSVTSQWDVKGTRGQAYKEQYDSGVAWAKDATSALDKTIGDMRSVTITEGYTESQSQTLLGSPAGAPGALSVEAGRGLGGFVGQSPMSAPAAAAVAAAGNRTGDAASAAAGGVGAQQTANENEIYGRQGAMFDDQNTLTGSASGARRKIVVHTHGIMATYGDQARGIYADIGKDTREIKAKNLQVSNSSIFETIGQGGVHVNPTE